MKEKSKKSVETETNTNPFPIYPDSGKPVDPKKKQSGKISDEELTCDVNMVNPDPNSLDRG